MLFVIFVLLLFIRKNIYCFTGLNDWKNVPNLFLLVKYDVCSFTFHSKQYLNLHLKKRFLKPKKETETTMHCDVCSFNFSFEVYLCHYFTKFLEYQIKKFRNNFCLLIAMFVVSLLIRKSI